MYVTEMKIISACVPWCYEFHNNGSEIEVSKHHPRSFTSCITVQCNRNVGPSSFCHSWHVEAQRFFMLVVEVLEGQISSPVEAKGIQGEWRGSPMSGSPEPS